MLSTASDCGKTNEVTLESRFEGDGLAKVLLPGSAYGNTVTIRVTYTDNTDGVTYYTDYIVSLERSLSLKNISASYSGSSLPLQRKTVSRQATVWMKRIQHIDPCGCNDVGSAATKAYRKPEVR